MPRMRVLPISMKPDNRLGKAVIRILALKQRHALAADAGSDDDR